jgi:hypothetical protein
MIIRTLTCLLLASPALAREAPGPAPASEVRCDDVAHRAWLSHCLELNGPRNPPGWQWPESAPGYFAQADLVREFTTDCASRTLAPLDGASAASGGCSWQSHVDWLEDCLQQIRELVGKRRSDISRRFDTEGGLSTASQRDYQVRGCVPLKAEVRFAPESASGDESPGDLVVEIVPYVGWFVAD